MIQVFVKVSVYARMHLCLMDVCLAPCVLVPVFMYMSGLCIHHRRDSYQGISSGKPSTKSFC